MSENNLKFSSVTDLELLDKTFLYLAQLCLYLPSSFLYHHCLDAMASIFELSYYLKQRNLSDYGNY